MNFNSPIIALSPVIGCAQSSLGASSSEQGDSVSRIRLSIPGFWKCMVHHWHQCFVLVIVSWRGMDNDWAWTVVRTPYDGGHPTHEAISHPLLHIERTKRKCNATQLIEKQAGIHGDLLSARHSANTARSKEGEKSALPVHVKPSIE